VNEPSPTQDIQRRFYNLAYPPGGRARADGLPGFVRALELHRTDAALRLLPDRGGSLLDIGCGDGTLLIKAASRFDRVTGLDVSDTQLAAARRNIDASGVQNAALVLANLDRGLPIQSAHLDVVTVIAVVAFVFDPIAALDEIYRVLRPGGQLVLEVLNLAYLPRRVAVLGGRLPAHTTAYGWEGGHLHNFTRTALLQLLGERGFTVERCTGSGVLTPLRTWWPGLLLGNIIARARK
jgi:ubiquinone/menaquinone biosynthesis C-methylase UbiE